MTIRKRVEKLEQAYLSSIDDGLGTPQNDEEWLESFEELGRSGYFDGEPDFQTSVAYYRQAILDAARSDPSFFPPDDFLPGLPENERRGRWRRGRRYPDLVLAFSWLDEMCDRVLDGKPPVTEAEFRELAEWFQANEDLLPSNGCIDLGGGRSIVRGNLRYGLSKGPRCWGVTELVEGLRELRELLESRAICRYPTYRVDCSSANG